MRDEYDFSQGKRGPVIPPNPKMMRITLNLESDIINYFKEQVHQKGGGNYQNLINDALREYIQQQEQPLEVILRRIIREELQQSFIQPIPVSTTVASATL